MNLFPVNCDVINIYLIPFDMLMKQCPCPDMWLISFLLITRAQTAQ